MLSLHLCQLLILLLRTNFGRCEVGDGDIKRVTIKDVSHDYGLGSVAGKEISLFGEDDFEEQAEISPKESLFSRDFKVTECSGSACEEQKMTPQEEQNVTRCTFGGRLKSDPGSRVAVTGCLEDGNMDISVISDKGNLKYNTYRVDDKGVHVDKNFSSSDAMKAKSSKKDWENSGADYADDGLFSGPRLPSFLNHKGYTLSMIYENKDDPTSPSECCRGTRSKCEEGREECEIKKGRKLCGEKCKKLLEKIKLIEKEQKEKKRSKHEGSTESSEESFEDLSSEESSESEEKKEKEKQKMGIETGEKISDKQLRMLAKMSNEKPRRSKNPLCRAKKKLFRSATFISMCGGGRCNNKEPYPEQQIYSESTIEVGYYLDRHLYDNMKELLATEDHATIKDALLKCVYQLTTGVEAFLVHDTFTSKGGFKMIINGVTIFKEHGKDQADWDEQRRADDMLTLFEKYANKMNSMCDADLHSYDAMVILSGRNDWEDQKGSGIGYAGVGGVCTAAPCIFLTLKLTPQGGIDIIMAPLLAHEFGHLLGSDHDGANNGAGCQPGQELMSPTVGLTMKTFSTCTKQMIDAEFDKRAKAGKDCLRT